MNLDKSSMAMPEQHCVRRGYAIVNAFDCGSAHGREAYPHPLPNIPLRADKTLLADMLRRGEFTGTYRRRTYPLAPPMRKQKPMDFVREAERFIGKLLGIEIEYYPASDCRVAPAYQNRDFRGGVYEVVGDGSLNYGGAKLTS